MGISEQVNALRKLAEERVNSRLVYDAMLQAANMERSEDCGEELSKAKEAIRKLLCNEYGSSCQFCIHDDNKEAMCCKVGGSGGWCCENAEWNGKS